MSEPAVWPTVKIGECCDILDYCRIPLNAEERAQVPGDVPYYGANGIQGYIGKFIFDEPLILLAEDGGYFEEYETRPIAYRIRGRSWVNNHAHVLRVADSNPRSQDFVFYCLEHKNLIPFIKGGTRAKLNQAELREIIIPDPPFAVQQRIARILSTVDETIKQTEALIAKTQQIKAGLMHDLFTRGVTADGRLRPSREEAPQLYKESPLGWIPKEWHSEGIDSIGTWTSGGTPAKAQSDFWGGNLPWVTPKDMKVFRLESTQDTLTPMGVATGSRVVPKGSVFIVVRGMILAHTFPVCLAMVPMAFNQDVKALVPGPRASGEFLAYWFASSKDYMLGLVTEATHGTKRIDMRDIFRSHIGLPPANEQEEIVRILKEVDAKLEATRSEALKLQEVKSGLMQDLLTGRVPVAVETAPETKEVSAHV